VRMYPVDLVELDEDFCVAETAEGEVSSKGGKGEQVGKSVEADRGEQSEISSHGDWEERGVIFSGRRTKYEAMEDLTAEAASLMEDLYQSGFDTVHDSTLKDIQKAAELTGQYGMAYLSELLSAMAEEISLSRHRMERKTASMAGLYTNVSEYLYLCRQKTAYDRGESYYCNSVC